MCLCIDLQEKKEEMLYIQVLSDITSEKRDYGWSVIKSFYQCILMFLQSEHIHITF